ncbi:hypothetical protein [Undibacterium sp.]|uniref:hypothetical protein n=1 Tax=Undibacterium sp. TaxID=1914977 RepID=UPI002D800C04|nr:hypothetical protein [Undibacterium sp.]
MNMIDSRSLNTSSCTANGFLKLTGPTWRHATGLRTYSHGWEQVRLAVSPVQAIECDSQRLPGFLNERIMPLRPAFQVRAEGARRGGNPLQRVRQRHDRNSREHDETQKKILQASGFFFRMEM